MIEVRSLTKRFGRTIAVDNLSFSVEPGKVTGFLGPNGAGKSTTMRVILGLDHPSGGSATIEGVAYRDLHDPLRTVGALLEARSIHGGRSARNHLLFLAQSQGLPARRVDEVLDLVGLRSVAGKRVKGYSLGMSQRLGIAAAMLGNPRVLLLDEPVNGLDPEGVLWVRTLMRQLAAEGRTILVSSHLMNEMAVTADHLIVIGKGRLIADASTADLIGANARKSVRVRTPQADRLAELVIAAGGQVARGGIQSGNDQIGAGGRNGPATADAGESGDGADRDVLTVEDLSAPRIGEIAAAASIVLHELTPQTATLERAFLDLTSGSLEFSGMDAAARDLPQAVRVRSDTDAQSVPEARSVTEAQEEPR